MEFTTETGIDFSSYTKQKISGLVEIRLEGEGFILITNNPKMELVDGIPTIVNDIPLKQNFNSLSIQELEGRILVEITRMQDLMNQINEVKADMAIAVGE